MALLIVLLCAALFVANNAYNRFLDNRARDRAVVVRLRRYAGLPPVEPSELD